MTWIIAVTGKAGLKRVGIAPAADKEAAVDAVLLPPSKIILTIRPILVNERAIPDKVVAPLKVTVVENSS